MFPRACVCLGPQSAVFDCTNQETNASSPLRLSQIELLVDSNYGDYAFCNLCYQGYDPYGHGPSSLSPTRCNQGEYVCNCQHRGFGPATCNGVVGNLDVAGFFTIIQPVQQVVQQNALVALPVLLIGGPKLLSPLCCAG